MTLHNPAHPSPTGYPIDTNTALRLTLARQHLAKGDTLSQAAAACEMSRGELDVLLWRSLGTPTLKPRVHVEEGGE